jgi:hypothetical protein
MNGREMLIRKWWSSILEILFLGEISNGFEIYRELDGCLTKIEKIVQL